MAEPIATWLNVSAFLYSARMPSLYTKETKETKNFVFRRRRSQRKKSSGAPRRVLYRGGSTFY